MATLTPTSKLDAVNSILIGTGEAPVNTLGSGLQEAEIAEVILIILVEKYKVEDGHLILILEKL